MKGLFKSRSRISSLGSWGKESDVDDSVVPEDRPWIPRSPDLNIGAGEYLSPEDDDSEESSTLRAIKTQDEVPRGNAALTLAAKTYRSKGKEGKGKTFLLLNYSKHN